MTPITRRSFLAAGPVLLVPAAARAAGVAPTFPAHAPELVQEMVTVAHGNVSRVRELVGRQPALAKAAWDWGFGDWEDALGAASHMGNREIAEFLIANGARPTIFSSAMLGQLEVVKSFVRAAPGVERTKGPHSITLLKHAVAGGPAAQAVVEFLQTLPGADEMPPTAPLSDADRARITGSYAYEGGSIDVSVSKNGQMTFARSKGVVRPLAHLGALVFVPAGAERVRVAFSESGEELILTVKDPDVVLVARKARG